MSKVLLIVGAGLSQGSLGLPADKDFLDRNIREIEDNFFLCLALEKLYPRRGMHWKDFRLEIVWSEIVGNQKNPKIVLMPNEIENIYNKLKSLARSEQITKQKRTYYSYFQYENDVSKTPYEYLFEFAEWELTKLVQKTFTRTLPAEKKGIYQQLIEHCVGVGNSLEIVSFNYDTLIEQALDKFYYSSFTIPPEGIKVIKPHGSINWYQDINLEYPSEPEELVSTSDLSLDDFGFEKNRFYKHGIVGLIDKKFEKRTARRSNFEIGLSDLRSSIEQSDSIFIVGYSFPSGDRHIRGMLRAAKSNMQLHKVDPIKNILLVRPLASDESIEDLKANLNDIFFVEKDKIEIIPEKWENWAEQISKN